MPLRTARYRHGWKHMTGSGTYETVDGRGQVCTRFIGFRVQYDAYLDGRLIGTRNQRGQAMTFIENQISNSKKEI